MTTKLEKELKKPRSFKISTGKRPKVLLLGNGISRAFSEQNSWDDLLAKISDESIPLPITNEMPMPLKATLLSKNGKNLVKKLKELIDNKDNPWGFSVDDSQKEFLQKLLKLKFDYILTTNYSYEIECASLNMSQIIKGHIEDAKSYYTTEKNILPQNKFYITTFNRIQDKLNGGKHDVWHIHGDAITPESIALNNEYYGKLVGRYSEWIRNKAEEQDGYTSNYKNRKPEKIKSWIDAFLFGNLYILGFGMNFSETDLWWLLEYKAKDQEVFGKTLFFDKDLKNKAKTDFKAWCKYKLFEILKVQVEDRGGKISDFKDFYEEAYEYLKNDPLKKKNETQKK